MIKSLRKRFIIFSVLVISVIIFLVALFIFIGGESDVSAHRYVVTLSLAIVLVFIGSWLLSKVAIRPIQTVWQKQLDFTADASHELRTPITVIQTNLDVIMDRPDETVGSQIKWLKNIESENKRMAKLVEDLLTLSRADTDQQMLEKEMFILDEVVAEAIAPFEPIANEKNIELVMNINNQINFYGDKKRVHQLLVILFDNALNYTDSGTVTVELSQSEKNIKITVSDTGHGIDAEHISKIFDRFYRVTKTRNLNQGGLGLGLPIAKWIVEEHGGTIKISSVPSEGTSFEVQLPKMT